MARRHVPGLKVKQKAIPPIGEGAFATCCSLPATVYAKVLVLPAELMEQPHKGTPGSGAGASGSRVPRNFVFRSGARRKVMRAVEASKECALGAGRCAPRTPEAQRGVFGITIPAA